jgi:hypothetical protein
MRNLLFSAVLLTCVACSRDARRDAPAAEAPSDRPGTVASAPDSSSVEAAIGVLSDYYQAITARDFEHAYRLWGQDGAASGKTLDQFAAGFAETTRSVLVRSVPGQIEGAAGSRYLDVAVAVEAVTRAGEPQKFEGTYTLRRVEVDGATAEQHRWHIESAKLRKVE